MIRPRAGGGPREGGRGDGFGVASWVVGALPVREALTFAVSGKRIEWSPLRFGKVHCPRLSLKNTRAVQGGALTDI